MLNYYPSLWWTEPRCHGLLVAAQMLDLDWGLCFGDLRAVSRACLMRHHIGKFKRIVWGSGEICGDPGYNGKVKCKSCRGVPAAHQRRSLIISNTLISHYLRGPCRHVTRGREKDSGGPLSGWTWRKPGINFWRTGLMSFRPEPRSYKAFSITRRLRGRQDDKADHLLTRHAAVRTQHTRGAKRID